MSHVINRKLATFIAAAVLAAAPAISSAASHGDRDRSDDYRQRFEQRDDRHRGRDFDRHDGGAARIEINRGRGDERVWVEPVYRNVCEQRWIEPVYRDVVDRVWVEPVVQRVTERVWVPDKYKYESVDMFGRTGMLRQKLVCPGHYEDRCRDVVIAPGHDEEHCRKELVCAGHYANVDRQELVTPGHWERREQCATDDGFRFDLRIGR